MYYVHIGMAITVFHVPEIIMQTTTEDVLESMMLANSGELVEFVKDVHMDG